MGYGETESAAFVPERMRGSPIGVLSGASASTAKPTEAHAKHLHELASRLSSQNERLYRVLTRLVGPEPQNATPGKEMPEPNGVLMVAQFGATRISHSIDELDSLLSRLESIA